MVSKLKAGLILASVFILFIAKGQDKEFSKSSLKYGIGIGFYENLFNEGGGELLSIGYQRDLWKDRLRLNPNLTIGLFGTRTFTDVHDQWFNSINLETILYFDIIRLNAFSLTVGAGGVINSIKGLSGSGGYSQYDRSEYISDWYYGGFLGGGLRINPKNSRVAIDVMPLNLHIGPDYYAEVYAMIGLEVKLK